MYRHTGDYAYRKMVGDYAYMRGDPGLFSFIGKTLGSLGKTVLGASPIGGVVGAGARAAGRILKRPTTRAFGTGVGLGIAGAGAVREFREKDGKELKKRRRMNVTNVKALRRAIRRGRGFVKIARKTVGMFGLTVARRGARRKK